MVFGLLMGCLVGDDVPTLPLWYAECVPEEFVHDPYVEYLGQDVVFHVEGDSETLHWFPEREVVQTDVVLGYIGRWNGHGCVPARGAEPPHRVALLEFAERF